MYIHIRYGPTCISLLRSSMSAEWSLTARSLGQNRLSSVIQEDSTESGATTRCGPSMPRSNLRWARNAIVWRVLPSPVRRETGHTHKHTTKTTPHNIRQEQHHRWVNAEVELEMGEEGDCL